MSGLHLASRRTYERTHPWITFSARELCKPSQELWLMLGECQSKCEHIAGAALDPVIARKLRQLSLVKGVRGTAAIEGNTLSEEEIKQQIEGSLVLPPSREYLAQEIQNILDGLNLLHDEALEGVPLCINAVGVSRLNGILLKDLLLEKDVIPGSIRKHTVGVMRYRGAPAEDCEYLVDRLGDWLRGDDFASKPSNKIAMAITKAVVAHLYLAWIHPFGDGNGRTARLVEFYILFGAGVPAPAAHLLSNHYNLTRAEYYRQLDHASQSGGEIAPFIRYAVQGLLDGLREQLGVIREAQYEVIWRNYVYEAFGDTTNKPSLRRRELVLALSKQEKPVRFAQLASLNAKTLGYYSQVSKATLGRDLVDLIDKDLIKIASEGIFANKEIVKAFLPNRADVEKIAASEAMAAG